MARYPQLDAALSQPFSSGSHISGPVRGTALCLGARVLEAPPLRAREQRRRLLAPSPNADEIMSELFGLALSATARHCSSKLDAFSILRIYTANTA
jgi:hypothetical protein